MEQWRKRQDERKIRTMSDTMSDTKMNDKDDRNKKNENMILTMNSQETQEKQR